MAKVIVYVDDPDHAQQTLSPLLALDTAATTHWVLVACAPRMTHRISKWVSRSARENWRSKWSQRLFAQILASVKVRPECISTVVAEGPLDEFTEQLRAAEHESPSLIDARKPKAPPETSPGHQRSTPRSSLYGTLGSVLSGCSALWMLAVE